MKRQAPKAQIDCEGPPGKVQQEIECETRGIVGIQSVEEQAGGEIFQQEGRAQGPKIQEHLFLHSTNSTGSGIF